MSSYESGNCKIEINLCKRSNISHIHLNNLTKTMCEKINQAIRDGCTISFSGDYDTFIDVLVEKETQ